MQEIIDFGSGMVFEDVSAYTIILIAGPKRSNRFRLTRVPPPPSPAALAAAEARGSDLATELPASELTDAEWNLDLPAERDLLARLARENPTLREVCGNVVFRGVVTGADYVYRLTDLGPSRIDPGVRRVRRRDTGEEGLIEDGLVRPVYAGRSDIRRFVASKASDVLFLPYGRPRRGARFDLLDQSELAASYPHAWSWLLEHEVTLRGRGGKWSDQDWWAYSRRQNLERFDEPKILIPYMIDHLCAHHDTGRHFFVNVSTGGYGIPDASLDNPDFVTAMLNSRLLSWALRRYSRAFRGDWFAARKGNLVRLPIAQPSTSAATRVIDLFHHCRTTQHAIDAARSDADRERANRLYRVASERFDRAVEDLYGLSETERAVVEAQG